MRSSKLTHKEILAKTGGISRNMINHVSLNQFHIPQDYQELFAIRRLVHYTGQQFTNHLRDGQLLSYVFHSHMTFNIIYQGCTPSQVKKAHEVLCSFRYPKEEYNLEPIVIVRIAKENLL